jgi:hypothetical protein
LALFLLFNHIHYSAQTANAEILLCKTLEKAAADALANCWPRVNVSYIKG